MEEGFRMKNVCMCSVWNLLCYAGVGWRDVIIA